MAKEDIKKIREMMEFLVKQKIVGRIDKLNTAEKKIYELTGVKSLREIMKSLNVGSHTISNLWKKLETEGILIKEGQGYRKVF